MSVPRIDTQGNTCDNKKMANADEKTLRRFRVFDTDGNRIRTVDITHQGKTLDMYAVKSGGQSYYAHTMTQALLFAETIYLNNARESGLTVKQVLL